MGSLRIALAQLNLTVGDIQGNAQRILAAAEEARDRLRADLVVFPELSLTGYPPEDLVLRPGLSRQVQSALAEISRRVRGVELVVGYPRRHEGRLYNACSVIGTGRIKATYHKQHLPNYSVFDEKRYFVPGTGAQIVEIKGIALALSICEDIWIAGTALQARDAGAQAVVNINASPFHLGKAAEREEVLKRACHESGLPIIYVNLVGGQDELVFDGGSTVLDADGTVCLRAPDFTEGIYPLDLDPGRPVSPRAGEVVPASRAEPGIYQALVLGVRDYARKNGFRGAVLGLSGGIDSALTLAIAADALGKDAVEAVLMPSRFSAEMSRTDAAEEARRLGVAYHTIPIEPAVRAFEESLGAVFAGRPRDATEENIQARCRGVILMAFSNKTGKLVLTTGNKSEMAVGYATLYGDMAGGFAPLKDVPKTLVYRLAAWRNRIAPVIPQRVFDRPPSAELAPGQKDEDSLPPYAVLDPILERYIEDDETPEEIVRAGFDAATVAKVVRMVDRNEYKRRQAAPGVRISQRAFGRDRRYPITSGYTEIDVSR
ncbi:MAG: NAD+ synthase [Pseudomonadota bacterium]|nr:NAD+ synthase [Pseudomonadota bacterium]